MNIFSMPFWLYPRYLTFFDVWKECDGRDYMTLCVKAVKLVAQGMGRKLSTLHAMRRGWRVIANELGTGRENVPRVGHALVHSQRSQVAAPVFRSAGQSAVPAFEGRVYFSNVRVAAFTCPLQTNFSAQSWRDPDR